MACFVLLHAEFLGGWVWRDVARELREHGHQVLCPTFTGCGERSHLAHAELTLSSWINDVSNAIYHEDLRRIHLVGHGFSGLIATALANKLGAKIVSLIYLDAAIPERGRDFLSLLSPQAQQDLSNARTASGFFRPPSAASMGVFGDDQRRWFEARLSAFPASLASEPFRFRRPESKHPPLVLCGPDSSRYARQLKRADKLGYRVSEPSLSPMPMVGASRLLARLLMAEATSLSEQDKPPAAVNNGLSLAAAG